MINAFASGADTGELAAVVDLDTQIKDVVFTPDGKGLYTANANTTCYLIDLGKVLPCVTFELRRFDAAFL